MEFIYPYTVEYFNAVIDILEKAGETTFNKLFEEWVKLLRQSEAQFMIRRKRKHSKPTKFTPSKTQLSNILKRMVDDGYLSKVVNEKSKLTLKNTNYQLTEDARKLLQMNILRIEDKQVIFKRIYEKILLHDFFRRVHRRVLQVLQQPGFLGIVERSMLFPDRTVKEITIESEQEFGNFLSKINIKHDQPNWNRIEEAFSSEIGRIIYAHDSPSKYLKKMKIEFWKKNKDYLKKNEKAWFLCLPIKENHNFWIYREEDWEISRKDKNRYDDFIPKLISRVYHIFIPGVTVDDVLESNGNNFERSEVQEAIDILETSKLIKREPFDVSRFTIADDDLHIFISDLKEVFITEMALLISKWELFESPTEEKKRMEWIFGEKEFKQISTKLEINLSEHKKRMRNCENIEEYTEILKAESLKGYGTSHWDLRLERYKQQRRKPTNKKENKWDIDKYRQYLRNDLQRLLDTLPINFGENGIHEIRIAYAKTIQKYSFLRDVVKMICPNVMKPITQEMEKEVGEYELRGKEWEESYKRQLNESRILKI
jgi:DNA-binding PadR family transcriptional regulator